MNYKNGDKVNCESCGQTLTVKLVESGTIAASLRSEMQVLALKCQDCSAIVCLNCSTVEPNEIKPPTCPFCKSFGGPFFIPK